MKTSFKNKSQTNYLYFLSALVFICGLCLSVWFGYDYLAGKVFPTAKVNNTSGQNDEPCFFTRKLDGVCVDSADDVNPKIVAVMIENHVDARPQSGLSVASIVYEAPVEANITRFMAVYPADAAVREVGPVRSARPYYLDWFKEYGDSVYMHIGGSPEAIEKIKTYNIFDIGEFAGERYIWRDSSRVAPHDAYTSSERWNKIWEKYNKESIFPTYTAWKYSEKKQVCTEDCVEDVVIDFNTLSYEVRWVFNTSTNKFERNLAGKRHLDRDGEQIFADNIIIQETKMKVLDDIGRKKIETIGSGQAIVFVGGKKIMGTWEKKDLDSRTLFFDSSGSEIVLNPGKTWVEIVPSLEIVE